MTPDQLALFEQLTPLQRRVCTALLVPGTTQRDAYKKAGGKAKSEASIDATVSGILSEPKVKLFLDAMAQAAVTSSIATRAEVLEFLTRVVRTPLSALADFEKIPVKVDEETGEVLATQTVWNIKDSALHDPQKLEIISELGVDKHGPKFKTHSQLQAAQLLAKLQGWEAPAKIDATVRTAKPAADMGPAEAARAYQDMMGS